MIKSGISQVGGKFRLRKELLKYTPHHEYFLSLFCGSCIYELNKNRANHYECFNDANSEYINYLEVLKYYPEELNKYSEGILGLVSRRIYADIKDGFLKPKDRIERASMFKYLVKLGFGSTVQFRGMIPETTSKKQFIKKAKTDFQYEIKASFKGQNGKTTRPYTNNDMGILTPLDEKATKRLRYVTLEELDFFECYLRFYTGYFKNKGLKRECFVYADPPYPATECYYGELFGEERHLDLIELMLETPFNFMLSIGGKCKLYLDIFKENGWVIVPVFTKYSTHANSQNKAKEFLIMNYRVAENEYAQKINTDIPEFPRMKKQKVSKQNSIINYAKIR